MSSCNGRGGDSTTTRTNKCHEVRDCCECSSCLHLINSMSMQHHQNDTESECSLLTKRFVTVGSVRYGVRLGAVSPPPPGAGPRYRQCCWPSPSSSSVSRLPLAINSRDIFSTTTTTSSSTNTTDAIPSVRGRLLRRRYERLLADPSDCDCDCLLNKSNNAVVVGASGTADYALDRLPRFRFGGNRGTVNKRLDNNTAAKQNKELVKELMDRRKRAPVPPPRTRHTPHSPTSPQPPQTAPILEQEPLERTVPHRSASFSEVDYSLDEKKYIIKRGKENCTTGDAEDTSGATLPRVKTTRRGEPPPSAPFIKEEEPETPEAIQEKKRDKSRRRKGMYIDQWPNNIPVPNEESKPKLDPNFSDIPRVQISAENDCTDIWTTLQEAPTSPEDETHLMEWPNTSQRPSLTSQSSEDKDTLRIKSLTLLRADSLSEGEPEPDRRSEVTDLSDCESRTSGNDMLSPHIPRRYSKRPLRGPYGQMLEAEMKKPEGSKKNQYDLKFLDDFTTNSGTCSLVSLSSSSSMGAGDPKPKYVTRTRGANHSLDESQLKNASPSPSLSPSPSPNKTLAKRKAGVDSDVSVDNNSGNKLMVNHQRTTSSPSKLEGFPSSPEASNELLEQLLRGSSEQLALNDTRTHVVIELYDTERHYVESLHTLVTKYLEPLKSPENAGLLDAGLVDEIFYQIPTLYSHHNVVRDELKKRLDHWDLKQKVGDILLSMYSNPVLIDSYTGYVNNCKRSTAIYKTAQQSKPAFARFLGATVKEHKGKLSLDELLIKPIQIFPKHELLLHRLIKHTNTSHPDYELLLSAEREIHSQLLKINGPDRESLGLDQLREIEGLVEGLIELVAADRQYLRHDSLQMKSSGGGLKERALFLFSDLLLITSVKKKSGTTRKPNNLDANKYKLLMKISLDDLEIVRGVKDENLKQMMLEIEKLTEDVATLNHIQELVWSLHRGHAQLEEVVREMLGGMSKQLNEHQNSESQLSCLELSIASTGSLNETVSLVFTKPEKRASWEESFNEAKHKLAISGDRRPCPELLATVPIRKTRAGLQFTCAAPTLGEKGHDVWVCNSDGYVGQVCVLSLQPEPTVTSCNGVCNARILCIASVPGLHADPNKEIDFDSSSSDSEEKSFDEDESHSHEDRFNLAKSTDNVSSDSDPDLTCQSTMWLGTEDGCIHVYNSSDNIRIKKNKIRLQHGAAILCIIYLENKVFVSLANGDLTIYERDPSGSGSWNTTGPTTLTLTTPQMPVARMLPNGGKLWCACGNNIKVLNTETLNVDNTFTVNNNDIYKAIACLVVAGNGVWLSLQNTATVKCYHVNGFELLSEVNVAPAVTKMLTSCDDIIRQHKAACLRVTALLACKDLLWIGTSAGVLLTMPLPHISVGTTKLPSVPSVAGVPHGHTGHVRFLSHVEADIQGKEVKGKSPAPGGGANSATSTSSATGAKLLVISGGDGYEDFRSSNISEVAGREDSTNHLLMWHI